MERYAGVVIGMAMIMAGARTLTPADFGVFAVGMSVVMLLDVLRDFGAGTYLVQLEALERSAVRSAFTVFCIISGSCAAALALAVIPLGCFYGESGVGHVVLVLSTALPLNPFSTPAIAMLRQQMAFNRLAMINVASGLGQLVTIVLRASRGQGYMAMAWSGLVAVLLRTLGANIARPMPWAFRPSLAQHWGQSPPRRYHAGTGGHRRGLYRHPCVAHAGGTTGDGACGPGGGAAAAPTGRPAGRPAAPRRLPRHQLAGIARMGRPCGAGGWAVTPSRRRAPA